MSRLLRHVSVTSLGAMVLSLAAVRLVESVAVQDACETATMTRSRPSSLPSVSTLPTSHRDRAAGHALFTGMSVALPILDSRRTRGALVLIALSLGAAVLLVARVRSALGAASHKAAGACRHEWARPEADDRWQCGRCGVEQRQCPHLSWEFHWPDTIWVCRFCGERRTHASSNASS